MSKIDIKAIVNNLDTSELKYLVTLAQDILSNVFNGNTIKENIKESRFSKGYECPKCQHTNVNKNGKSQGRQRYICKRCRTSFDEMSYSPFSSTKLGLDKWLKYCELMIVGLSIRDCAREIEVSIPTSFFMRHRILDVLNVSLRNDIVDGIVEVDEMFLRESFKGNHSKDRDFIWTREPRKRGKGKKDSKKRGISSEQVCIETAIDRKGNIVMGVACRGRITSSDIVTFFDGRLGKEVTFCTDSHKSYPSTTKNLNVELKQIPRGKQMIDDVYHLQHINSLHSSFKRWIVHFNGVATKYLNNYLAWFKFLQLSKKNKNSNRIQDLLINVATKDTYITIETIKNRLVEIM